jgi:hypothetical protein
MSTEQMSEPIESAISEVVHDTYDQKTTTGSQLIASGLEEQLNKLAKLHADDSRAKGKFTAGDMFALDDGVKSRSQNSDDEPANEERVQSLLGNNSIRSKGWGSATKEVFLRLGLRVLLASFVGLAFFLLISSYADLGTYGDKI